MRSSKRVTLGDLSPSFSLLDAGEGKRDPGSVVEIRRLGVVSRMGDDVERFDLYVELGKDVPSPASIFGP